MHACVFTFLPIRSKCIDRILRHVHVMINSPFAPTDRLGYSEWGSGEGAAPRREEFMIPAFLKDLQRSLALMCV